MLEERAALLGLQEMDLEVHKAILAVEQERSSCPSAELEKFCARMDQIADDCVAKAEQLS
jgi:hypothetical protein